jgi:hypothetical protein
MNEDTGATEQYVGYVGADSASSAFRGEDGRKIDYASNGDWIDENFRYHAPKQGQIERYEALRAKAKEYSRMIDKLCPPGREKLNALMKIEESVMWANAAIARGE